MSNRTMALPLTLVMAALLSAAPAMAQGNSQNRGNPPRAELREQDRDRDRDRDRDKPRLDRRQDGKQVPPGWCIGRGNPHNTPANCGYNRDRRGDDRARTSDRRSGTYDSRSGSYDQRHAEFHRRHDAECRERARRAGMSPAELLRVRERLRPHPRRVAPPRGDRPPVGASLRRTSGPSPVRGGGAVLVWEGHPRSADEPTPVARRETLARSVVFML